MANTNEEIAQDITDTILTGGSRTLAVSFRLILNKILNSFPNFKNGGRSFEVEVGYKDSFRPVFPGSFATVDMILSGPESPIREQYWRTNIPNPEDGLYHIIKVTRGVDGIEQQEDIGPESI